MNVREHRKRRNCHLQTGMMAFGSEAKTKSFAFFAQTTPYGRQAHGPTLVVGFPGIGLVASHLCLPEWSGNGGDLRFARARLRKSPGVFPASRRYHKNRFGSGKLRFPGIESGPQMCGAAERD
ncbi:hypothetical protein QLQ09_14505 [Brucella sp. NM4]|uniref:hypothetical protein n=1 Tax=Ochrobactrum sp. SSR TaxID=3045176 RepID=UPI0024BCF655|nr:hypothetical protein [Brucella sp. NM4]WHS31047.1 hypothetical protein QLQ09_14505 [Brucella sp. NM4]WHT42497.1 hypothetical protein QLQ11_02935 [Ochrobactrum sp. SSR]